MKQIQRAKKIDTPFSNFTSSFKKGLDPKKNHHSEENIMCFFE